MSLGSLENASMEERFLIEFQALSEIHVTGLNSREINVEEKILRIEIISKFSFSSAEQYKMEQKQTKTKKKDQIRK